MINGRFREAELFNLSGQYDIALDSVQQTLAFAPDLGFAWHYENALGLIDQQSANNIVFRYLFIV